MSRDSLSSNSEPLLDASSSSRGGRAAEGNGNEEADLVNKAAKRWAGSSDAAYLYAGASVLIYWVSVSAVPIYNKFFFNKKAFPFPIATAGIQLGCVSVLLALWSAVSHSCFGKEGSWIFGPHFLYKLKWCAPIGVIFGAKYALTNLGLFLIDTQTHLLLQSTDIIWTILFAWIIVRESVSWVEFACAASSVVGSVLLSIQLSEKVEAPFLGIAVNLSSPIFLGLAISTLRLACKELMRTDNRLGGKMSSVELTAIKLALSSAVALFFSIFLEGPFQYNLGPASHDQAWWSAMHDLAAKGSLIPLGVCGGALLILIFQVNITFLSFLTSATAVGLCGQAKVVPQWGAAAIFAVHKAPSNAYNVIGGILTMGSAAAYAVIRYLKSEAHEDAEREETEGDKNAAADVRNPAYGSSDSVL